MRPGREGHLPARVRGGRPSAGRVPPARDRPRHRRRAARDHPQAASSRQTELPEIPIAADAGRRRRRGRRAPPQPAARARRPARQPGGTTVMTSPTATPATSDVLDALLRAVVPALAVLREDARGRLLGLRHLQPHVPAGLLRRPDRGVLGAAQRRDRVGRVGRAHRRDHAGPTRRPSPTCSPAAT